MAFLLAHPDRDLRVYALALLAALLTTGRLSDHLGRRPVVLLALMVQIVSMVAFIAARGVGMLFAARVLQGLGTGLATGALSAWLLDLQPPDNPRLGSLVASVAPVAGLAAGALVSGLLVQYGPDPLHLVFSLLCAVFVLAFAAMPVIDDVAMRTPGWLQSMRPQIGVPPAARSLFAASAPSLIATWALGGLYLSLGPSLALSLLKSDSYLAGAGVIVALMVVYWLSSSSFFLPLRVSALVSTTLCKGCSRYIRVSAIHPRHCEAHAHNNLFARDG